jgi:hypothetical protein
MMLIALIKQFDSYKPVYAGQSAMLLGRTLIGYVLDEATSYKYPLYQ